MKVDRTVALNLALHMVILITYLSPSIFNGFPLLTSDSGTYLASGQTSEVPLDRPIIYGLFIRHISLSWSLWLPLIVQIVFINYSIYATVRFVLKMDKYSFIAYFITSMFLFFFTGIGYHSNILIADIFTSICILLTIIAILIPKQHKWHLAFVLLLLSFSIITHLSHAMLVPALAISGFIVVFFVRRILNVRRLVLIFGVVAVSLTALATINYSFGVGFKLSRIKNVVLSARLADAGILERYLKEQCPLPNKKYGELCAYVGQFDKWPTAGHYLWVETSPIYQGDCKGERWTLCWFEKEKQYEHLMTDVLNIPKYRNDIIAQAIAGSFKQLFLFQQERLESISIGSIIDRYYPFDSYSFAHSNQHKKDVIFDRAALIETITVQISFLLICVLLIRYYKTIPFKVKLMLLYTSLGLIINAAICSTFSNVVARYQGRIIFLIPLSAVILCFSVVSKKYTLKRR